MASFVGQKGIKSQADLISGIVFSIICEWVDLYIKSNLLASKFTYWQIT